MSDKQHKKHNNPGAGKDREESKEKKRGKAQGQTMGAIESH